MIHHDPSLSIMIHHDPSWSIIIHHDPSWSIMIHHDPSWSIMIHHYPSLSIIIHHYPSWSIMIHHDPSLFIIIHHYPSWSHIISTMVGYHIIFPSNHPSMCTNLLGPRFKRLCRLRSPSLCKRPTRGRPKDRGWRKHVLGRSSWWVCKIGGFEQLDCVTPKPKFCFGGIRSVPFMLRTPRRYSPTWIQKMCGWSISISRINHPNHLFSSLVKSLDGMNKSPAAKDHRPNHSDHSCSWPKSCHSGPPWSLQVISAQHVALSIYFQQGSLIFQNKCWQYKEWSSKGTWQEPGVPWNDMFTVVRISWSTSGSCSFNPPCRPFLLLGS